MVLLLIDCTVLTVIYYDVTMYLSRGHLTILDGAIHQHSLLKLPDVMSNQTDAVDMLVEVNAHSSTSTLPWWCMMVRQLYSAKLAEAW